ncbi:hypothetical protein [Flavobacterium sp. GCM10027622]|uniref:hypothetical protein n=1 Tax=unclassified Flavobacterium TaxID=196869 RepID=UPI00360DDEB4
MKSNFRCLLLLLFVSLANCKENQVKENQVDNIAESKINFDDYLKCSEYSPDDKYFLTADYGCLYDPKGKNPKGNLAIYLIPKGNFKAKIDDQYPINKLSNDEIKGNFKILLFLIEPNHLNYNPKGDPNYYQKDTYEEICYTFDNDKKEWIKLSSFHKQKNDTEEKNIQWRDHLINQNLSITAKDTDKTDKNPKNWIGKYEAIIELDRAEGTFKLNYTFLFSSPEEIKLLTVINGEKSEYELKIKETKESAIVLITEDEYEDEYEIVKENNKYFLTGKAAYQINPPNEKYDLEKVK